MPASGASLLLNAEAVLTALLAWFVFKENFDRRIAVGMVAIVAGAVVLSWPNDARFAGAWPALAVQPLIIFPTGQAHLVSDQISFGLIGIASADLPAALHVDVNAGLIAVGQKDPAGYLPQGLVSAVLSWAVLERLSVWGEVFFFSPAQRAGRGQLGLDAGLMYFVTNRLALDAAVFTTVAGAGPDFAFRAGFSVLFGR
jgi:drug/metabolite transporter (DMT)-like permease